MSSDTQPIDVGLNLPVGLLPATAPRPGLRMRPLVRPLLAVALIVGAYHHSLRTLVESLTLSTPVAQLGLAPFIALGLAVLARPRTDEPDIHDRQLDWIVGLPLLVGALLANLILPVRLSTMFWYWRIDLLTLPVFIAGVVALLFGVRTLWRIRAAVLFLLLAWPYPYTEIVNRFLDRFTQLTIAGITMLSRVFPVAEVIPGGDGSLFQVNADTPFKVQIASACSGANGLVGFTLVGTAFLIAVKGPRRAKVAWLVTGALLTWLTNLVRIMAVLGAGRLYGESFAIDGLHPYIGLVIFSLTVLAMVLLLRRFGLRIDLGNRSAPGDDRRREPVVRPAYRPRWKSAAVAVVAVTVVVGALNTDLSSADRVGTSLGTPRLSNFAARQSSPRSWRVQEQQTYNWPKQYFGKSSTWIRYSFLNQSGVGALSANVPVIADIIETSSRRSLAAYGVEQCYEFHNFDINSQQTVDLGGGIVGGLLTWRDPKTDVTTTTLYWHWPVKTDSGTRFERVTLQVYDNPLLEFHYPQLDPTLSQKVRVGLSNVIDGDNPSDQLSQRLVDTRAFLIGFAEQFIDTRAPAED